MLSTDHSTNDRVLTAAWELHAMKLNAGKTPVGDLVDRRMSEASNASTAYQNVRSARGSMDLSGFEEHLHSTSLKTSSASMHPLAEHRRYSVAFLLSLRKTADNNVVAVIDCDEVMKSHIDAPRTTPPVGSEPRVIRLRAQPESSNNKSIIKYHTDLDVPEHRVIDAHNLGQHCQWPHVNTFVKKVVGIEPLAVRMCRRNNVPTAMIMFATDEEADTFERMIPQLSTMTIKGKSPRFHRRTSVVQAAIPLRRMSMLADMKCNEGGRKCSVLPELPEDVDMTRRQSLWPDAKLGE